MTVPVKAPPKGDIIESVIAKGDLSKLTPDERTQYYVQLCKSLGLNPHTQPFSYITLSGKLTLYAKRDAADQLRKIHGISIKILSQEVADGLLTVHVSATDKTGRTDEDVGVVPFGDFLKGEKRSNEIMKCVTKAKRRVTLSISGLGFLDETEVESIPTNGKSPPPPGVNVMLPPHDPQTGEIEPPPPSPASAAATAPSSPLAEDGAVEDEDELESARLDRLDARLAEEAEKGGKALKDLWLTMATEDRKALKGALDERHKVRAAEVDKEGKY